MKNFQVAATLTKYPSNLTKLIPVWSDASADKFVDKTLYTPTITEEGIVTSFLKFGVRLDLMGISRTLSTSDSNTDSIDPAVTLHKILFTDPAGVVYIADVSTQPFSTFVFHPNNDFSTLSLDNTITLNADGKCGNVLLSGKINLEMCTLKIDAGELSGNFIAQGYTLLTHTHNMNRCPIVPEKIDDPVKNDNTLTPNPLIRHIQKPLICAVISSNDVHVHPLGSGKKWTPSHNAALKELFETRVHSISGFHNNFSIAKNVENADSSAPKVSYVFNFDDLNPTFIFHETYGRSVENLAIELGNRLATTHPDGSYFDLLVYEPDALLKNPVTAWICRNMAIDYHQSTHGIEGSSKCGVLCQMRFSCDVVRGDEAIAMAKLHIDGINTDISVA